MQGDHNTEMKLRRKQRHPDKSKRQSPLLRKHVHRVQLPTFARWGRAFELQLGAEPAGQRVCPRQRVPRMALVPHEIS